MKAATKTQKVDTSKLGERVAERRHPNRSGLPHGNQELPYDLPVNIEVERVLASIGDPPAMGLIGWIVELGCFVHGGKNVWIKLYRDPVALVIEVDGEEVWRWVQNPDDQPVKFRQIIDKLSEEGNDFVEANDILDGDEVLDGDIPGTYEVKRRRRTKAEKQAQTTRPLFVEGDDVLD